MWARLYSDFLLPSRLPEYRALLERAASRGYAFRSTGAYFDAGPDPSGRTLVLRHDVDTDPATAEAQWKIERDLGASASYFFRLSTADRAVMRRIAGGGGEVGYHFEEVATVAKEERLRSKAAVKARLPAIQQRFGANLTALRERTGLPLEAVAAHGDMVNRHLGYANRKLLNGRTRHRCAVRYEAYDEAAVAGVVSRFVDHSHPGGWRPQSPWAAIERGDAVVYLLTHPRHWRRNVRVNLADDLGRLRDGLRYHGRLG